MIETQLLGSAVGIQRQDVIDKTEGSVLPSLTNGVIIGRFKRGRMDKAFKVTNSNYRALLGNDPSNPSFQVLEDAFNRGISEIHILRVGAVGGIAPPPVSTLPSYINLSLPLPDGQLGGLGV